MIIPQVLSSKVADCIHTDKHLLSNVYKYIHNSCSSLGQYSANDKFFNPINCCSRKPAHSNKIEWVVPPNVSISRQSANSCYFSFFYQNTSRFKITESVQLKNGIYAFKVSNICCQHTGVILSIDIINQSRIYLYTYPLTSNDVVTMSVHDDDMFLKLISPGKVKSTVCISESKPFSVCISALSYASHHHSFYIYDCSEY